MPVPSGHNAARGVAAEVAVNTALHNREERLRLASTPGKAPELCPTRSSHLMLRSLASSAAECPLWPGMTWSNCMITSAPRLISIAITRSGVKCRSDPSMCERKVTPSSVTALSDASENTWKPPESVRIGPFHPMNRCRPPSVRMTSSPGRRCK